MTQQLKQRGARTNFIKMARYSRRRITSRSRRLYNKNIPFSDGFGISAHNHKLKQVKKQSINPRKRKFLDLSNKLADKIQHAEHSLIRGEKRAAKYLEKEGSKATKWALKEAKLGIEAFVTSKATKWAVEGLTALFDIIAAPETGGASLAALPEELQAEEIEMTLLQRTAS